MIDQVGEIEGLVCKDEKTMDKWRDCFIISSDQDLRDGVEWPKTNLAIDSDIIDGVEDPEANQIE